jgi:hypothetical protein
MLSHQAKGARTGEVGGTNRAHRVVMHMNPGDARVQNKAVNNIRNLYQKVDRERLQLEWTYIKPERWAIADQNFHRR